MAKFVVERTFPAPVSDDDLAMTNERMAPCLDIYDVTWIRSFLSQDRRRMICEFEGVDSESVRNVQREAGAMFDKIWPANVLE